MPVPTENPILQKLKSAEALDLEVCDFFIFPERSERLQTMDLLRTATPESNRRILRELSKE